MKKFLLTFTIVVCLMIGIGVVSADAATYTGSCGDNVTYSLDTTTGILTISGTGDMVDYTWTNSAPWYSDSELIKNVVINDGVTRVGDAAFDGCDALTSVTISDSVTSIGNDAFCNCESLTEITIPGGVVKLGRSIFSYCENLTKVVLLDGVPTIGGDMFYECKNLEEISIPNSVKVIESYAFCGCTNLKSITIPESVVWIGEGTFYDCLSLDSVNISCNIKSIEMSAFCECIGLKDITIPDGVTNIAKRAFRECDNLTNVTIPKSVTSIGNAAFYYCDNLTDVYYGGSESEWAEIDFGIWGNDELLNATIHYTENIESESGDEVDVPDTDGSSPEIGKTTLIFTPKNATEGDVIAVLTTQNDISTAQAKTYSGSGTVTFEIEDGFDSIKILVWESYESMEPLMEYVTIE